MKIEQRLITGDVIYGSCTGHILCHHVGIVLDDGRKKMVYHNSPYNKNRYGGSVCSESYDTFMSERELVKIIRTGVSAERILKVSRKCRREVWSSFFFNCEDYVSQIVEKERKSDIRDAWRIAALGVFIISILDLD